MVDDAAAVVLTANQKSFDGPCDLWLGAEHNSPTIQDECRRLQAEPHSALASAGPALPDRNG